MVNKINLYVFIQILKSCTLIFFIFLSISWLLQLTRLFTITNLLQIDIINVIYLSTYLIPNLLTVIIPFVIIFGILLCFIKLNRDKEIISIFSLGLELKPIKYSLYLFSLIVIIIYLSLNFYISPIIYEKYKLKEFELRNTINIDKMIISNFIKINKNTTIDFKKNDEDFYENIFINFNDENENIIFAKKGLIKNEKNKYFFQLNDGFKISIYKNQIEKLEFENYVLNINNESNLEFNNYDRNTKTIFDDIINKNYINILFKIIDVVFSILIIYIFYRNNILNLDFNLKNNIFFIVCSVLILIINQLLKNSEINISFYILTIGALICLTFLILRFKLKL